MSVIIGPPPASGGSSFDPHSPGPIGDVTPGPGAFTTLGATSLTIGGNVTLQSDGADILAQRNGTNPQVLNVYNTCNGANWEAFSVDWQTSANVCRIGTTANGTGQVRQLHFTVGGFDVGNFDGNGIFNASAGAVLATVRTNVPSGAAGAADWGLGVARTGVGLVPSTTTGIQVALGGVLYTLAVLTTNP